MKRFPFNTDSAEYRKIYDLFAHYERPGALTIGDGDPWERECARKLESHTNETIRHHDFISDASFPWSELTPPARLYFFRGLVRLALEDRNIEHWSEWGGFYLIDSVLGGDDFFELCSEQQRHAIANLIRYLVLTRGRGENVLESFRDRALFVADQWDR